MRLLKWGCGLVGTVRLPSYGYFPNEIILWGKTCCYYQEYIIPSSMDDFVRSWWNSKCRSDFCLLGCAIKIISSDRINKAFFKLCYLKCSAGFGRRGLAAVSQGLPIGEPSVHSWLHWSSSLVAPGKCFPLEPKQGTSPDLCLWLWAGTWDKPASSRTVTVRSWCVCWVCSLPGVC